MDYRHCLLMIGISFGCGCHIYQIATYNLINEIEFRKDKDRHRERLTERAEQVWLWTVVAGCSDLAVNEDYHTGFIDGFVDYALDGGIGVPPPVPTPGYRRYTALSPAGIGAIDSWNAGFAAGSAAAYADTQGRNWLTVPVVGYDPNSRIQSAVDFGTADVAPGVPSSSTLNPPTLGMPNLGPQSTNPPLTVPPPANVVPTLPEDPLLVPPTQPEDPLLVPPTTSDTLPTKPPMVPPTMSDPLPPMPPKVLPKPVPDSEALPLPSLPALPK